MGFISSATTFVVDGITFPISYIPKAVNGRSFGDYVTGNTPPAPRNTGGAAAGAFVVDVLTSPVSLPVRAFTGNSIGDYVTGDTLEKREIAERSELANEEFMVRSRQNARQQGMGPQMQADVSTPSIGASQSMSRVR